MRGKLAGSALAIVVVLGACSTIGLENLADTTCQSLRAPRIVPRRIVDLAVTEAEALGYSALELFVKMENKCADEMREIGSIVEEQREDALPDQIELVAECRLGGAEGTVKNNSIVTVTVLIEVQFTDNSGVLLDTDFVPVRLLPPGQTGIWEASYSGDSSYDQCRAEINRVFDY